MSEGKVQRTGEGEPLKKGPVKFRYQKGADYQRLVDRGIAKDLASSGFCWLASIEMAASAYKQNDAERLSWVVEIATDAKSGGLLEEDGHLSHTDDTKVVEFLNKSLSAGEIPLEASSVDLRETNLFEEALRGNMLLVSVYNPDEGGGHMMLVDKGYLAIDQSEAVVGILNPIAPAIEMPFAREYFGSSQSNLFIQGQQSQFGPNGFILKPSK